jgi:hypothetical protein
MSDSLTVNKLGYLKDVEWVWRVEDGNFSHYFLIIKCRSQQFNWEVAFCQSATHFDFSEIGDRFKKFLQSSLIPPDTKIIF